MGERPNRVGKISRWLVSFYSDPKYLPALLMDELRYMLTVRLDGTELPTLRDISYIKLGLTIFISMFCAGLLTTVVAISWVDIEAEKARMAAAAEAARVIETVRQEAEKTAEVVRISTQQAHEALQQKRQAQAIADAERSAIRLAESLVSEATQSAEAEKQAGIQQTNREVCEYWQVAYRKDGTANSLNFRDQACQRAGIRASLQ
jgi:hypothetical protein